MQPEARLDALLSALDRDDQDAAKGARQVGRAPVDAELAPLVQAAGEVAVLRRAAPDPHFAGDLRLRMLARTDALRTQGTTREDGRSASAVPAARSRAPLWIGLAAAALIAVGMGTVTAAAHAGPASPLFGLHRLEQSVQVAATTDDAGRARLHMSYARQWLTSLSQAAQQHQGSDAFQAALSAMLQENAAAQSALAHVTDGATQASLQASLNGLLHDERAGLHAALPQVAWPDQIAGTDALGQLGEAIPQVTQVQVAAQDSGIQVTIDGSGFAPGAQLIINGRPAGQVLSSTPTQLVVTLSRDRAGEGVESIGIRNPDGTAAQAPRSALGNLYPGGQNGAGTPGDNQYQRTPDTGDAPGHGTPTPGSHQGGGDGGGTPTPQPSRTPDH